MTTDFVHLEDSVRCGLKMELSTDKPEDCMQHECLEEIGYVSDSVRDEHATDFVPDLLLKEEWSQDMEPVKQEPSVETSPANSVKQEILQNSEPPDVGYHFLSLKMESKNEVTVVDHSIPLREGSETVKLWSSDDDMSDTGSNITAEISSQSSVFSTRKAEFLNSESSIIEDDSKVIWKGNKETLSEQSVDDGKSHTMYNMYKGTKRVTLLPINVSEPTMKLFHKCEICGKLYKEKHKLTSHLQIHSGEEDHKCGVCGKCFTCRSSLIYHLKIHSGEKDLECADCGKCFTHPSSLKRHLKVHSGEKSYKCVECGICFARNSSLSEHLKIHSGQKDHKCAECGKYFTYSRNLTTHLKIHFGEKTHKCLECEKSFTRQSSLQRHLKVHSGEKNHKCGICGNYFTHPSSLSLHLKLHSGQKDYKCGECAKCFTQRSHLRLHLRIHSKERTINV